MPQFTKAKRQAIIDDYLRKTGENLFVAAKFVDWLSDYKDHEAYEWFYGLGDEEAARQYRIDLARNMASGLRVTATFSSAPTQAKSVSVKSRDYPAMISPMSMRTSGGGYISFDPADDKCMSEFKNEAAMTLRSWIKRYRVAIDDNTAVTLEGIASSMEAALEGV